MVQPDNKSNIKWTIIGSLCVTVYASLTTLNQVAFKVSGLSIVQVALSRYCIQFTLACLWWNLKKPETPYLFNSFHQTDSNGDHVIIQNWFGDKPFIFNIWMRGILYAVCQIMMLISLFLLPIGDMLCIKFQRPLLIAYFGAVFLKEKLPDLYILIPASVMSVTGIILLTQPSFLLEMIEPNYHYQPLNASGLILVFTATILYIPMVLLIRTAKKAHFLQLEFATSGCMCFITIPITLLLNHFFLNIPLIGDLNISHWRLDLDAIGYMIFFGLCGFLQVSTIVVGYQLGDSTQVSWLEYITIPMGFLYQSIVFDDTPNKYESIGGILVTTGCLLPLIKQIYLYFTKNKDYESVRSQDSEYLTDSEYITDGVETDVEA